MEGLTSRSSAFITFLALTKSEATQGIAVDQAALLPIHRQLQTQLTDAPSVKLHVLLKHTSTRIHEYAGFDVFTNPIVLNNGTNLFNDGYGKFVEDNTEFTYAFVNGSGYLETSTNSSDGELKRQIQCLPFSTLPFHAILPALNDATRIPSASIGDKTIECSSGNLFKTSFVGSRFAICASGTSGFTAFSSDLIVDVEYLNALNFVTYSVNGFQ